MFVFSYFVLSYLTDIFVELFDCYTHLCVLSLFHPLFFTPLARSISVSYIHIPPWRVFIVAYSTWFVISIYYSVHANPSVLITFFLCWAKFVRLFMSIEWIIHSISLYLCTLFTSLSNPSLPHSQYHCFCFAYSHSPIVGYENDDDIVRR